MFVFTISARISFSSLPSSAHSNRCPCKVSLILSGSVFDTGALTWAGFNYSLSFALLELLTDTKYSVQVTHAESCSERSKQPFYLQYPLCENCWLSSSTTKSWFKGMTWWYSLLVILEAFTQPHNLYASNSFTSTETVTLCIVRRYLRYRSWSSTRNDPNTFTVKHRLWLSSMIISSSGSRNRSTCFLRTSLSTNNFCCQSLIDFKPFNLWHNSLNVL